MRFLRLHARYTLFRIWLQMMQISIEWISYEFGNRNNIKLLRKCFPQKSCDIHGYEITKLKSRIKSNNMSYLTKLVKSARDKQKNRTIWQMFFVLEQLLGKNRKTDSVIREIRVNSRNSRIIC